MREVGAEKFSSASVSITSWKRGYQAPHTHLQMVGDGTKAALESFPNQYIRNINAISKTNNVQGLFERGGM